MTSTSGSDASAAICIFGDRVADEAVARPRATFNKRQDGD